MKWNSQLLRIIAAIALAAACAFDLASEFVASWNQRGPSYIGYFDKKFETIRLELTRSGSQSVGYLVESPFEELSVQNRGFFLQAQYGVAPIFVHAAKSDDAFVILDARIQPAPQVPTRFKAFKILGDGIFLLKAAQ